MISVPASIAMPPCDLWTPAPTRSRARSRRGFGIARANARKQPTQGLAARSPRTGRVSVRASREEAYRRLRAAQRQHPVPTGPSARQQTAAPCYARPTRDGHFLPDNPLQANAVVELRNSLRAHFHGVPNVVVEGDMFLYYAKGEADERLVRGKRVGKYVAPDLIVVLDYDLGDRQTYKVWEEGKPPDFSLEVISPSSDVRNRVDKQELYARIGIGEYFVFQPNPERAGPQLVGYALEGSGYRALGPDPELGPEAGSVRSEALGVSFRPEGSFLRVRDLRSGQHYRWHTELVTQADEDAEARRRAEETAVREAEARKAAETRIAALEAKLARRGQ